MTPGWEQTPIEREGAPTTTGAELEEVRRLAGSGEGDKALARGVRLAAELLDLDLLDAAGELLGELLALAATAEPTPESRVSLTSLEAALAARRGDLRTAEEATERQLEQLRTMAPSPWRSDALATGLRNLGYLHAPSDPERAEALLREALAQQREDPLAAGELLWSIAQLWSERDELARASAAVDELQTLAGGLDDTRLASLAQELRAEVAVRREDFALAEEAFAAAREAAPPDDERRPRLLLNLGTSIARQGREQEAIELYREGLRGAPDPDRDGIASALHRALGMSFARLERTAEALEQLELAIAAARRLADPLATAEARMLHASVRLDAGADVPAAIAELELVAGLLMEIDARAGVHRARQELARGHQLLGDRERADAIVQDALADTRDDEQDARAELADFAMRLWAQAPAYGARAAAYLERRLDALAAAGHDDHVVAWNAAVGASLLIGGGAPSHALPYLDRALHDFDTLEDPRLAWFVRRDRALAAIAVQEPEAARADLDWCRELSATLDDRVLRFDVELAEAELARRELEMGATIAHLRAALELSQQLLDRQNEAHVLGMLAIAVGFTGDLAQARALLERQLELAQSLGLSAQQAHAVQGLASAALGEGDLARAVEGYAHALELDPGDDPLRTLQQLGGLLIAHAMAEQEQETQATRERLLALAHAVGREDEAALALRHVAEQHLRADREAAAREAYVAALELAATRVRRLHSPSGGATTPSWEQLIEELAPALAMIVASIVANTEQQVSAASRAGFYEALLAELEQRAPGLAGVVSRFVELALRNRA